MHAPRRQVLRLEGMGFFRGVIPVQENGERRFFGRRGQEQVGIDAVQLLVFPGGYGKRSAQPELIHIGLVTEQIAPEVLEGGGSDRRYAGSRLLPDAAARQHEPGNREENRGCADSFCSHAPDGSTCLSGLSTRLLTLR